MKRASVLRRGFTLIELIAVVVILAILAGVALPRYFDYAVQAKVSSAKGTLGGVRAGIANFMANNAIGGGAVDYPTLVELQTLGTVMQEALPDNPYNDLNTIVVATAAEAAARTAPVIAGASGWAYYVDNTLTPSAYTFYANTDTAAVSENDF